MKESLALKLYRKNTVLKIERKIKLLGIYNKLDTFTFLSLRLFLTVLIFVFFLLFSKLGFILAPLCALLFYLLFEMLVLDYPISKRAKKLEKEALFFFEVFALTLEGGRTLKHALDLTVENVDSELSLEFKKALAEVRLGKSLNESLKNLKTRIPSDTINNTILNMMESNSFGNNILDSIYSQIDYLRDKQILSVKAEIAKLPTKISVISVLFFVPIMLLIILAPLFIQYLTK